MSNKITVTTTPKNRISISTGFVGRGATYLTELKDIDASDADNNETIVYDEASGKYVVKQIPVINGGEF